MVRSIHQGGAYPQLPNCCIQANTVYPKTCRVNAPCPSATRSTSLYVADYFNTRRSLLVRDCQLEPSTLSRCLLVLRWLVALICDGAAALNHKRKLTKLEGVIDAKQFPSEDKNGPSAANKHHPQKYSIVSVEAVASVTALLMRKGREKWGWLSCCIDESNERLSYSLLDSNKRSEALHATLK